MDIQFVLNSFPDSPGYLLRISSGYGISQVRVNGHFLSSKPIHRNQEVLWLIPASCLRKGNNHLFLEELQNKSIEKPIEIELYGLPGTAEVLHFEEIFSEQVYGVKTQPATDPLQLKYDVIHVELQQSITMTHSNITASMMMIGEVIDTTSSLSTVVLDFNGYSGFFSVKSVDQGPANQGVGNLPYELDYGKNRLYIALPEPMPAFSRFTVRVYYSGIPYPYTSGSPWGGYNSWTQGTTGIPIIFSLSEPYGARNWWPCKDIPDDKFTADLYWECPTTYFAVSNGKLIDCEIVGNGTHRFHYQETYPISSYLVSVACSKYEYVFGIYTSLNHSFMTVGHYLYPDQTESEGESASGTLDLMEFLAGKFGEYPFLSDKYVTSTFPSSGMEHQTCTGLGAGLLSPDGRGVLNCHELAHQWFGDALTMGHFNHLWLNEGFATYAEALWKEKEGGIEAYHRYVDNWTTKDTYPLVSSHADEFSPYIVYRKGAWVLHMLRHIMGDSDFYKGMKSYAADSSLKYGNVLSSDFQSHMEKALGQDTSLAWFFNPWLYQSNRPVYSYHWSQHLGGTETVLDLTVEQTQTGGYYSMPLDIRVKLTNGKQITYRIWNTQFPIEEIQIPMGDLVTVSSLEFDPDNWVLKFMAETLVEDWNLY